MSRFALTTYDVSLAVTGTDDMPLVEETDVTPARIVEVMRKLLAPTKGTYPTAHVVVESSSHAHADGTVTTLKSWRINQWGDDLTSFAHAEKLNLVVGTTTEMVTVAMMKTRERHAHRAWVEARTAHGDDAVVTMTAKAAWQRVAARTEDIERRYYATTTPRPRQFGHIGAEGNPERHIEAVVHGERA